MLAVAPAPGMARERILSLLWPEASADKGRRLLSEAIYQVRREIDEGVIITSGDMLRLDPAVLPSDVAAFRDAIARGALVEAAALYTAPFLDGWYVEDAPEFERWASDTRQSLEQEHRAALAALATKAESAADWSLAAQWLERLARSDPFSPAVAVRLATALDADGRRAAALQALGTHVELLRTELELPPDASVARALAALRQPARAVAPPSQPASVARRDDVAPTPAPDALPVTDAPAPMPRGPVVVNASRAPDTRVAPRASGRRWQLALGGLAVVVAGLAYRSTRAAPPPPPSDATKIAVLYFDDHSQDHRLAHIADGLTEELIHQLAGVPALDVISRNGVKPYRSMLVSLDSVVKALGVGTVIEGSVQESGDRIRVTMQVIDGHTGVHTHSQVFEHRKSELFALEEELASSVAMALRRRLGRDVVVRDLRQGARNVEALALVYRARGLRDDLRALAMHPDSPDRASADATLQRADSMLQAARRADPAWAVPLLERGWLWVTANRLARRVEALRRAEALADTVLAIDSLQPEALHLRGTARVRQLTAGASFAEASLPAERDLRRSVAQDSTRAQAWAQLGELLVLRGAFAEAELASRRALEEDVWLDGADQAYFMGFASSHMLGKFDDARSWCSRGRLAFPASWRFLECELTLLRDDTRRRADPARAWAIVAQLDSLDPPSSVEATGHPYSAIYRRALAASVVARSGQADAALSELRRLQARVQSDSVLGTDLLYDAAMVQYYAGDRTAARASLEALQRARPLLRQSLARDSLVAWLTADALRAGKP